jgi:hypothetical protein
LSTDAVTVWSPSPVYFQMMVPAERFVPWPGHDTAKSSMRTAFEPLSGADTSALNFLSAVFACTVHEPDPQSFPSW